jgi:hypothetical protein
MINTTAMKSILAYTILLFTCVRGFSQDIKNLGRTYEEVLESHKSTGGVKTPKTNIDSEGYKQLYYECTDDKDSGLDSFNYRFKNNVCIALCVLVHNQLEVLQKFYNKKYQYDEDANVWYDNSNNIMIKLTGFNDFYTVWFEPKRALMILKREVE